VIAKGVSGYAPTSDQISRKLGMPIEAVRGRLGLLSRDGSVLNQNSGYHITESGREFLGNPSLSGTSPASRNNKRNSKKFFRTHQRRPDLDSNIMYVLKESGSAGMGSADVSEYLDIPTGTASHHMSTLARKGLIGHISPLYYHLDFMPQIKATE
jgi:predicted ArsR family transcriptional regulator